MHARRTTVLVLLAAAAVAVALAVAPAASHAAVLDQSLDDAGYLRVADRMQLRLDGLWDERAQMYRAGPGGVEPMVNAAMLLSHAVAAQAGHTGPSRNDHRARLVAERLLRTPPFVTQRPRPRAGERQQHAPGWTNSMHDAQGGMHLVVDAEIVDGLVHAWRARRALALPERTADAIASAIRRTAEGAFWRYPALRLNQVNWYATIYAAAAEVTGSAWLLRRDLRAQLVRFARSAVGGPGTAAGSFGAGMRFHYLPHERATHPMNVDSAEYANIVLAFSRHYERARAAGMAPLAPADLRLVREWTRRALAGYWTHAGYLNWDTGLGFRRWHQSKKLGLAQEALIGIASSESLQFAPEAGPWAKQLLDAGLLWFDAQAERSRGIPDGVFFGVREVPQGAGSARLGVARIQANAARAIAAGLGRMPGRRPPPLYAFDPDIGRLAVTTPAYNTAIVAVNQRAFPYGGIDLARLYDGEQDVAASIGGTGTAAFGLRVRDAGGRVVATTQAPRPSVSRGVTPLRLTRAPSGVGATARTRPGRAFAGRFGDLRSRGVVRAGGHRLTAEHRFTPAWIETRWTAAPLIARARARRTVEASFPSTGRGAAVTAVLRDGTLRPVGRGPLALADVAFISVRSEHSGYVVILRSAPAGARLRAVRPAPQPSAPQPGPTALVSVAGAGSAATTLRARIAVVRDPADVGGVARRLGATVTLPPG